METKGVIDMFLKSGGTVQKIPGANAAEFGYISIPDLLVFSGSVIQYFGGIQKTVKDCAPKFSDIPPVKTDSAGMLIIPNVLIDDSPVPKTKKTFMRATLEKNRALVAENETLKRRIGELLEQYKHA